MMRTRFFRNTKVQAAIVLVLATFVGVGTYLYLLSYQARINEANSLTPVLVAKSEIPMGMSLGEIFDDDLFAIENLPKDSIPSNALEPESNPDLSLKSRGPLSPGQILVSSFFATEVRADVGLSIPRGMLAVTISVDDVSRVGNFVLPGSRVVVFSTSTPNSGAPITNILLEEALVIGIGDQTEVDLTAATPASSPLVTVALSPADAKRLILTSKSAQLTLALAHANDPIEVLDGQASSDGTNVGGN